MAAEMLNRSGRRKKSIQCSVFRILRVARGALRRFSGCQRRFLGPVAAALSLMSLSSHPSALAAGSPDAQPGFLKAEFIYETAPFPSCHASTIAETKAGLIAAWFGGTAERNPDVGIWVSRQENG